jgi:hypothetical protein
MKKYLLLIIFFCNCSTFSNLINNQRLGIAEERQNAEAWANFENEEIITILEQVPNKFFVVDFDRNIILLFSNCTDGKIMNCFLRASIFYNGTLFIDGVKKDVSQKHKNRLIKFYKKIFNDANMVRQLLNIAEQKINENKE